MQDFVAIDFETANGRRSSVCSVGIVIVRGGEIVDKFYSLIQPAPMPAENTLPTEAKESATLQVCL